MALPLRAVGRLLSASLLLSACGVGGAPEGVIDSCKEELALPPGVSTDILFVIDNSGSMAGAQAKVVAELETFVSVLLEGPIANDFQVGVVTTGVSRNVQLCEADAPPELLRYEAESGRLQTGKDERGRPLDPPGPTILAWDDPAFFSEFRMLISQGVQGSGQEMGLEAMRLALSEPLASAPDGNAGFLRPGSRLLVVIVSDEDDCSDPTGRALALGPACEDVPCDSDEACGAQGIYCLSDGEGTARLCAPNFCETDEGRALLEPVERYVDFLQGLDDGTGRGRLRETFLAVIGSVGVDAPHEPARCMEGDAEAQGIAVRYREAVERMGESAYVDSICSESYGTALRQIASLVSAPQVIELTRSPADGRLLLVDLTRANGEKERCRHGEGFSFEAATSKSAARVTLEGACRLRHGDKIEIQLLCAG